MLELDPRIKDMTKIKCIINADCSLVGKTGYFTTNLNAFKDLSLCSFHGKVKEICFDDCNNNIFVVEDDDGVIVHEYYFIADEDLLPAKEEYRAFTIEEFTSKYDVGEVVRFRHKQTTDKSKFYPQSVRALVDSIEYYRDDPLIRMKARWYSLKTLFEEYELWNSELGWIPFGVKVNG